MTRKDYIAIARILNAELSVETHTTAQRAVCNVARSLADVLKRDNTRFDRQRFYDAVTDGTTVERMIA